MSDERPFDDLPRGRYAAIVADPPWSYACFSENGQGPLSRPPLRHHGTLDEIEQLPVGELAACRRICFSGSRARAWFGECISRLSRAWGFEPLLNRIRLDQADRKRVCKRRFFLDELYLPKAWATPLAKTPSTWCWRGEASRSRLRKDVHQLIIQPRREHTPQAR